MIFCFKAQALVCLMPSLRPSSTELIPFLAVTISHIARNHVVSGSLVAWKPGFPRWLGFRLTSCPAFGREVRRLRGKRWLLLLSPVASDLVQPPVSA